MFDSLPETVLMNTLSKLPPEDGFNFLLSLLKRKWLRYLLNYLSHTRLPSNLLKLIEKKMPDIHRKHLRVWNAAGRLYLDTYFPYLR